MKKVKEKEKGDVIFEIETWIFIDKREKKSFFIIFSLVFVSTFLRSFLPI